MTAWIYRLACIYNAYTMFKFDFINDNEKTEDIEKVKDECSPQCRPSLEVSLSAGTHGVERSEVLRAVEPFAVSDQVTVFKGVIRADDRHVSRDLSMPSDIIPGEYEGGYKIWECSIDLSRYIASLGSESIMDKRIIELGSGQGLPGVTAMALGAAEVHFQDYDAEVIETLTIPVVRENMKSLDSERCKTRFFSGDWGTLDTDVLEGLGLSGSYDIVLTSETIYNIDSTSRLLQCIQKCLRKPDGVCFLSAKSFYFGVGGGVAAFKSLVDHDGCMKHETVLVIDDGKSNRREIIKLSFT